MDSYYPKYLKYKNKYLKLKTIILNQNGGSQFPDVNESPKMIDRQKKIEKRTTNNKLRNQLGLEESAEPKVEPRKTDSRNTTGAEPKAEIREAESRNQQKAEQIVERRAEQKRAEQKRAEQKRAEQKRAEQKREEQERAEQKREMNKTKKAAFEFLSETSDEEPEMLSPTSSEFLSEIKKNNEVYKFREDSREEKPKSDLIMKESDVNMTETELNLPDELIDSESEEKPKEKTGFIDRIKNFFKNEKEDSNEIKELGDEPKENNKISSVLDKKIVLTPLEVNQSFDRNDLEKVKIINGITYRTKKEFTDRFWPCLFETCDLTWDKTKWTTIDKL